MKNLPCQSREIRLQPLSFPRHGFDAQLIPQELTDHRLPHVVLPHHWRTHRFLRDRHLNLRARPRPEPSSLALRGTRDVLEVGRESGSETQPCLSRHGKEERMMRNIE